MGIEDSSNAMFDKDEQEILSKLVADEGSEGTGNPEPKPAEVSQPAAETTSAAAEQTTTEPAQEAAAQPAASEAAAEEKPASAEPAQPQGDTRAALRASRRAEKRLRDQLEALQRENEALKQGKAPVDTSITDEELAQLDADFPLQAKIVRQQRALEEQLAKSASMSAQQSQEFEPLSYDPAVQEVIDGVPDLVAWQYDPAAQDKFLRAIDYDKALSVDPDWKDRNVTERFAEAARRAKAAFAPSPAPTPTPAAAAATRQDPAAVIASAPVQGPKGISDFRGGASATPPTTNYAGMTDEQIMSSLPAY